MIVQLGTGTYSTYTIMIRIADVDSKVYDVIVDGSSVSEVKKKALEEMEVFNKHPSFATLADMLTSPNIDEPPITMKIGGYNPIGFIYFKR